MTQMLVTLPDELAVRLKALIPVRQHSRVIAEVLQAELARREEELYQCALAVEQDAALQAEMAAWDVTLADGVEE